MTNSSDLNFCNDFSSELDLNCNSDSNSRTQICWFSDMEKVMLINFVTADVS